MATSSWNLRSLFSQDASRRKQDISGVTNKQSDHLYSSLIDDKKSRMRGTHTVRSHGIVVAKTHMYDWLILIVLTVIMIVLNFIHPFYRHVGKDMMTDLKYPLKDNTVPLWSIPVYTILFPITVFLAFYFRRRDVYDLHHAVLGLLFSMILTGVITIGIKDAVGRPRPDFFWRCFPDGKDLYDQLGNVICHGDSNVIKEGHKSFPCGYTSGSFAGLGFLSLYLSGKVRVFDCKGRVSKLCIVFLPLLTASLVGVSRVDDYWQHWQDVFAGALIGITMATFCYLQFFAPPYHTEGWGPYAFFRVLEESRSKFAGPSVSQANVPSTEIPVLESVDNPHLTPDDPESGFSCISIGRSSTRDTIMSAEKSQANGDGSDEQPEKKLFEYGKKTDDEIKQMMLEMQREIFTMSYNFPKDEEEFGVKVQGLQDEIDRRNKIYGHKGGITLEVEEPSQYYYQGRSHGDVSWSAERSDDKSLGSLSYLELLFKSFKEDCQRKKENAKLSES